MKSIQNSKLLRIALVAATCVLAPVALIAQSAPSPMQMDPNAPLPLPNQMPANPSNQDSIGAPGLTGQMMRDKMFLRDAVASNLAQVELGKLAVEKAISAEVKEFGQKMVTDHADLNQQIRQVADSLGVMVPKKVSKEDQATYDKLNALPADQFEAQYIVVMAQDHRKDLHAMREELVTTNEQSIHDAVEKAQLVVYAHTKDVQRIAKDKNIQLPVRKRPSPAAE